MAIDGNPKVKAALNAVRIGDKARGEKLQDEFVAELRESIKTRDHCSCTALCKYHGKCMECVAIHRAHQDHLPSCLWGIVNGRLAALSELTEYSIINDLQIK